MKTTKDTPKYILMILIPVLLSWFIWGQVLNPETYWQKLVSLVGAFITTLIIMRVEIEAIL